MNEFEWLKQTRALNQPVSPPSDLWPDIAQRIQASGAPSITRRQRLLPWPMAAALALVSVGAGWIAWHGQVRPSVRMAMTSGMPATITPWKPRDPRLVGAAIELNVARRELTAAIRAAPDDAFLQRMLDHANQQVARLQQLEHRAG